MPNPIVTNWQGAPQPTSIAWASGQSIQQWIEAAIARASSNLASDPPDPAYPISTTWTAADGAHTVSTPKNSGETDEQWIERHFAEVLAQMELHPPIP